MSASWAAGPGLPPRPTDEPRPADPGDEIPGADAEEADKPLLLGREGGWERSEWGVLYPPSAAPVAAKPPQSPAEDAVGRSDAAPAATATGSGWPLETPAAASRGVASAPDRQPGATLPQNPDRLGMQLPAVPAEGAVEPDRLLEGRSWAPFPPPASEDALVSTQVTDVEQERVQVAGSPTQPSGGTASRLPRARPGLQSWSMRRVVTVSLVVLTLTILTSYLASAVQPTVYAAQADVLFEVTGSAQEGERQLATQEVLLGSRGVLAPAAERFDVPLRDLTRSQTVEQIAGSQVLRTQVRNQDPGLAVRLAQAIADSYVESVSSGAVNTDVEQERRLRDEITDLSITVATGRARLEQIAAARAAAVAQGGALTATPEERQLQLQDTSLSQRISALQAQLTAILVARDNADRARVLTPAYLLDEPVGPRPERAAAAGALLGILLVAALVALASRRRPRELGPVMP